MKFAQSISVLAVTLMAAFAMPVAAEVVYTQVNVSIPVGGYYSVDLNRDGVGDFTLRAPVIQGLCQAGDEDIWSLTVNPGSAISVATPAGQSGTGLAAALPIGVPVNSAQGFSSGTLVMAELLWGNCGTRTVGYWMGLPAAYLGLRFQAADGSIHYGWAKMSTVAYVDNWDVVHATTILWGYAYETVPEQAIMAGQTSG